MKFKNKVVILTGAAGGIGLETTKAFASEGAKIVLVGRNINNLNTSVKEINLSDDNSLVVGGDVSKEEDVKNIFDLTIKKFGKIDILVNNAGYEGVISEIKDYPVDEFDKVISINLRGTFMCMKYGLQIMSKQGFGVIVNNASIGGLKGMPTTSAYNASKFAVVGLTRTAALEYAPKGLRINAVCPSPVETRMMRSIEAGTGSDIEAIQKAYKAYIPMGRYAKPIEITKAILFIASDDASFINGTTLTVDGAMIA